MSSHPICLLLALTFAPIYHCNPCRLQYRDWRPLAQHDDGQPGR